MKNTAYVGIDPGLSGAIGIIACDGCFVIDVPTYETKKGGREYNFYEMYKLLGNLAVRNDVKLVLEQQQAMPKQGVASTFKTGVGYGAWLALCWAVTNGFEVVSPRVWKKALGLSSDKGESLMKARLLFPSLDFRLSRKKDHNRAEALLLAHYIAYEGKR